MTNATTTITPLTLSVDLTRATLTFGPFLLEVVSEGEGYSLTTYWAADLAAHLPDEDWPVPVQECVLTRDGR